MQSLTDITKDLQRELGVDVDGSPGRVTISNALATIRSLKRDPEDGRPQQAPATVTDGVIFDARTEAVLATLDPKAVPLLRRFLCLAQGTAATLGCDYRLVSGNRTWDEQTALYAEGRTAPGHIVTNARAGYSWHNFGVAADAGVFQGKLYLEDGSAAQQQLAERVHKACSLHAEACGLRWGGDWKSIKDTPHFQVGTLPDSPTAAHRATYKAKGSVL